jgi:hypothetical protein
VLIKLSTFHFNLKLEHDVKVINCKNVLGKIPDYNINYSDHEGVYSEFEIKPNLHSGKVKIIVLIKIELIIT